MWMTEKQEDGKERQKNSNEKEPTGLGQSATDRVGKSEITQRGINTLLDEEKYQQTYALRLSKWGLGSSLCRAHTTKAESLL